MTSTVFYFCLLIVKYRSWLMHYRRNRVSFVSFAPLVYLISRVQCGWSWRLRLWGFLYRSICPLGLLYHSRVSFVLTTYTSCSPLPRLFPSLFCLSGTCWVLLLHRYMYLCICEPIQEDFCTVWFVEAVATTSDYAEVAHDVTLPGRA